ncbi:MAG: TIGR01212 family radical SAM protein [Treponema sp.]|jgi:radical SAM protein (TIGR01212 family)|nr:TIGR01212 family radical SAM protein [Treponema sp.]
MEKRFYSVSDFYKKRFGTKVFKISLDAGCTCPTRDGTKGRGGCIFCSAAGSGDFAASRMKPIHEQIGQAKQLVESKLRGRSGTTDGRFIAYFQNFTNTYGEPSVLEQKYCEAAAEPGIVGIAIATRPDCLDDGILNRIARLGDRTFVSIELGLQTSNETTAAFIRRGYPLSTYDAAVQRIRRANPAIHIVTHVIFGLPGETDADMLETVRHCTAAGTDGIKFTVLYVLAGTDLAAGYRAGSFSCMTQDDYFSIVARSLELLPPSVVVHRLTGDGPKRILIAPLWTANKRKVRNDMARYFTAHDVRQGSAEQISR